MSEFILKNGWRNDNALWVRIAPESKASIRELIGAINTINLSKNSIPLYADRIADSLKANLAHFFDQRYHLPVPLMTKTNFWHVVNDFERVANDLIIYGYCYEGREPILCLAQDAVRSCLQRYNTLLNISEVVKHVP